MSLIKKLYEKVNSEPVRFIMAGSFNTLFCYTIFVILLLVGMGNTLAMSIASLATICVGFFIMGRYVFACDLTIKRSIAFLAMQSVGFVININILRALSLTGISDYLGGIISLIMTAVFTFFISKYLVFMPITSKK